MHVDREVGHASIWYEPGWRPVLWLLLVLAFSPVLLDLARHIAAHPWARGVLLFPLLTWVAARVNPAPRRPDSTRSLYVALVIGLMFELVAVSGDAPRLGRLGLAIGWVGVVWGAAWAKPAVSVLLFWVIPLPSAVLALASPGLEDLFGRLMTSLVPGLEILREGRFPTWVTAEGVERLRLRPAMTGLPFLVTLAGLGWFSAVVRDAGWLVGIQSAFRWALLWVPFQLAVFLAAAICLTSLRNVDMAKGILEHSGWLLTLVIGLFVAIPWLRSEPRRDGKVIAC